MPKGFPFHCSDLRSSRPRLVRERVCPLSTFDRHTRLGLHCYIWTQRAASWRTCSATRKCRGVGRELEDTTAFNAVKDVRRRAASERPAAPSYTDAATHDLPAAGSKPPPNNFTIFNKSVLLHLPGDGSNTQMQRPDSPAIFKQTNRTCSHQAFDGASATAVPVGVEEVPLFGAPIPSFCFPHPLTSTPPSCPNPNQQLQTRSTAPFISALIQSSLFPSHARLTADVKNGTPKILAVSSTRMVGPAVATAARVGGMGRRG
ncbi:hypothetical protein DFJ73DRAFT_842832 [Zopfochytrium polystomum]|nr:hypothetical protein DFJ73DRAFT_842832 [Zopfochytrium polystomum]